MPVGREFQLMQNVKFRDRVVGKHHIVDVFGCNPQQINSESFVRKALLDAIDGIDVQLLDHSFYRFEPQGLTGFLLLSTSHVSIHTWPEYRYLSMDVYTCSDSDSSRVVANRVLERIQHTNAIVRSIDRTYPIPTTEDVVPSQLAIPIYSTGQVLYATITNWIKDIHSAFQHIQILDTVEYGRCMVIDGLVQTSTSDHHIYDSAMLQLLLPGDKTVLILGGGDGYLAEELLRRNPDTHVSIVEIDAEVVDLAKRHLNQQVFDNLNVELRIGDALEFLHTRTGPPLDGIAIDLTDNPLMALEGEYTDDFERFYRNLLKSCARQLRPSGWLTVQAGASRVQPNYLDAAVIISEVATQYFAEVLRYDVLVPSFGEENCFIACRK